MSCPPPDKVVSKSLSMSKFQYYYGLYSKLCGLKFIFHSCLSHSHMHNSYFDILFVPNLCLVSANAH